MRKLGLQHLVRVLAVLLLAGCGRSTLTPIPKDGTILSFGDSLTFGVGVERSNSYPAVLSELSGREVVNGGVSGEVTADGLKRLPKLLDEADPALLILLEGGNDILRNEQPDSVRRNLAAMIEMAESRGVEVVLLGVPEKNLFSKVAPFYEELAEEYRLVFEDDLIGDLLRKASYKSDPVHFNQQGYRVMAEAIFDLLVENGAL